MNKDNMGKLADGIAFPAGVATGASLLMGTEKVIGGVVGGVEGILEAGKDLTGSLFPAVSSAVVAPILTHRILDKFDWMNEHKKIKWALTAASSVGAFAGGAAIAPYVTAAGLVYAGGRVLSPVTKWALNRAAGTSWALTGGLAKSLGVGAWEGTKAFGRNLKAGVTGKQFDGQGLGRLNPKTYAMAA